MPLRFFAVRISKPHIYGRAAEIGQEILKKSIYKRKEMWYIQNELNKVADLKSGMGCKAPRVGHCEVRPLSGISQIRLVSRIFLPEPEIASQVPNRIPIRIFFAEELLPDWQQFFEPKSMFFPRSCPDRTVSPAVLCKARAKSARALLFPDKTKCTPGRFQAAAGGAADCDFNQ